MSFCILLLRHVIEPHFDNLWIETYKSIRKFYPDTHIKIIDNNSTCASLYPVVNCEIIKATYPESRLYSPFYEFLHMEGYSKAIILHDGFIFNTYVDFNTITPVKFFWHFEISDHVKHELEIQQLNTLDNNVELLTLYNSKTWLGCLGCLTVIDKEFINQLESRYKISRLATVICDQEGQIAFERILAVLCFQAYPAIKEAPSIEVSISNMLWGWRYNDYINNPSAQSNKPFFKLFGARK